MSNIFLCSDHHLSHSNILTFTNADGTKVRTFEHVDAMDEHIIECHNSVVSPQDTVYFLGDLTFSKKNMHLVGRMNGDKVLIKGNHDTLPLSAYLPYFRDIRGVHQFDGMILSHIPIHPDSLGRWGANVHGHLHTNRVMKAFGAQIDERYISVCMEQINYTPISLEDVKKKIPHRELKPRNPDRSCDSPG